MLRLFKPRRPPHLNKDRLVVCSVNLVGIDGHVIKIARQVWRREALVDEGVGVRSAFHFHGRVSVRIAVELNSTLSINDLNTNSPYLRSFRCHGHGQEMGRAHEGNSSHSLRRAHLPARRRRGRTGSQKPKVKGQREGASRRRVARKSKRTREEKGKGARFLQNVTHIFF